VLGWAVATANSRLADDAAEIGLRLAAALHWFWFIRGDYTEGRGWLSALLGLLGEGVHRGPDVPLAVRARALCAAGHLAYPQGDAQAARMLLHESLSLAQESEGRPVIAESLLGLGTVCWQQGEFEAARTHL